MYFAALILAIVAWAFQFYQTAGKKDNTINVWLPLVYAVACILFTVDAFLSNNMVPAVLDLICAIVVIAVFILLVTRKKAL